MPTPENLTLPERQRDDESSCSSDGSWDVLWGRTKQPTPSKCTMSKDPACAYRGFSTSLSHSFVNLREEPGDACALVCCGLLQQDRNRFLVMGKKPPSCAERIIALVFVPSCILAISIYLLLFVSDYDYDYVDFTSVAFLCLLVVYIGFLLWEASSRRAEFRRDVLWHKYGQTGAVLLPPEDLEELPPELREDYMMGQTARDSFRAHALIGCYDNDIVYKDMDAPPPQHILACLWRLYMASCCGTQGFYIQCCGVCGVAQETRDIDKIVPPHRRAVDYLTMQPVLEYYSEMMVHRKKCCTVVLSKLSWKILIAFVLSTVLTIGACLLLSPSHLQLMVSLPAVASIILGSVVCCSGLSTDAVIKFLACGFCIAGSMTFFAQGIVAVIVQGAIYIAMTLADGRDYYVGTYADDEYKTAFFIPLKMGFVAEFRKEYPISYLCCFFFYCFFVAAFIEEPIKYLAYRMLSDHPDFWSKRRLEIVIAGTRLDRRSTVDPDVLPNSQAQERTLRSRSAIFLVAMVAVSLGFACCENLLFALMCYNQDIEWRATLIRVLLLPIHPVCAAWQSIGVSQRDLEHNRNYQLGWILLPAVFWHGLFDFALLLGPVLVENEWVDVDEWLLPSVVLAIALLLLILNIIAQQVRLQGESEEGMDIWATLSCQFAPKNKFFKAKERAVAADSESGESYATATGVELISEAMDGIRFDLPEKKRKSWFAADAISHSVSSPEIPHCYSPPDIREIRTAPTDLRGSASDVSGVSSASESEASGKIVRWPSLERKESGSLVVSSIAPVQGLETTVLVHSEETEETAEDATALEESRYAKSEHDASDDNRSSSSPPTSAYSVNEPQTPQNLDKGKGAKRVCEVEIVPSRQQCHITTSPFQECVGEDESILQAPSGGTGVNYTAHMNNVANRLAAVQQFIAETNANLVPIGKSESVVVSASDRLAALQQILAETHANLPAVESSTSFDALSTPAVRQLGSRGIDVLSTSAARQLGLRANLSAIKANLPVADRSGTSVGAEATTQSQLYIGSRANLSTTQANPASDDHGDSIALDKASTQSQVTVNLSATQSNLPAADNDDDSIASDEATTQSQVTVNLPAAANNGDFTATVKAATQSQLVSYVNFPAADNDGNSIASDEATTRSQVTVVRTRL